MLIPILFLTDIPQTEDIPEILLPENASLVYRVKMGEIHLIRSFYQSLVARSVKAPFTLLIESDAVHSEAIPEELISYLISFTLHYKYQNLHYKTPLILFRSPDGSAPALISILRKRLVDQGYNGMDYIHIGADDTIIGSSLANRKWVIRSKAVAENYLSAAYNEILKSDSSAESQLLVFFHSIGELNNLITDLQHAEDDLLQLSPVIYYLLDRQKRVESGKKELEAEIGILKEKVDSLKSYYTFYNQPDSGYKKKITEIVDFYRTEYEILPLWYKQFGHIIKVLTGKRTFRSLYNNNAKKYKDQGASTKK